MWETARPYSASCIPASADDATRIRGLQGRTDVPADEGMLFTFPRAQVRSFWMADCLTDIDVVFLDPQGRVTALHRMKREPQRTSEESRLEYEARLSHYSSVYPAQFALEFGPGTLDQLGLAVGGKVDLDVSRLKALAR